MVTARTLPRDLLLQADRIEPSAYRLAPTADRGTAAPPPDKSVTIGVRGWSPHE
ncbi:hypothetical protein [Streptomyces sp. NPDC055189]